MHPEKQGKMKLKTLLSYGRETSSCETGTQEIRKLDRMLKKTGLQYNLQPIVDGDGNELMRLTFQTKDRDVVKLVIVLAYTIIYIGIISDFLYWRD